MSQAATLLRLLREAGPGGIHSFTCRRDHYIANPSARVQDLEALGHVISAEPERLHGSATGARYRLVHDAGGTGSKTGDARVATVLLERVVQLAPVEDESGAQLFDPGRSDTTLGTYKKEAA